MKVLTAIICLVLSNAVYAQIFTCENNGNVSYQEQPCETTNQSNSPVIEKSAIPARYLSYTTEEPVYADYYKTLIDKIEETGNRNYPAAAKRNKLNGNLLIQFILKSDGKIGDVFIRESSGTDVLDDAAVNILDSASPFARFPRDILKETSELIVTVRMDFLKPHTLKCRMK